MTAQNESFFKKAGLRDGIIAQLMYEGAVTVTASSFKWGHEPKNAIDLWQDSQFWSQDEPNSWICYDFGGLRVTPTSYSIISSFEGAGGCHPKSWVLEVSNDGSEGSWAVVDSRENNNDLNDWRVTRNFSLGTPQSGAFRFVRLRQTGKNHRNNNMLRLTSLDIFGQLSRSSAK